MNLQPEFYAEIDGVMMMWKFALTTRKRRESTIRSVLQMMARASTLKGLKLPIQQIRYFDVRTGSIYVESLIDRELEKKLAPTAAALAHTWRESA